jgi:adhesin/invasin
MEVPEKLRSALVGIRYWMFALLFLAASSLLLSCNGEEKTVIVVSEDIGTIILTIEDDSLVAGGLATTRVSAEVFKYNDGPVPDGTTVNFTVTPVGDIPASTITQNGIATVILTSDTIAGEYYITATAGDVGQVAFGEFVPGPADGDNTTLSANPTSIPADGTSTSLITLTAEDANGNPVADGTVVNFYTTHGTLSAATGVTSNGVATTVLTSSAGKGVIAQVTAGVDGLSKATTVGIGAAVGNGTGTASYIELSISEFTIRVKDSGGQENSNISVIAFDETGSQITDFPNNIRFSIESGPNGGEELDGSISPVIKSTVDGTASVSLTSGTVSGTVRIRVEVILDGTGSGAGAPFATALTTPIAIEAGEPSNIVIFQDNTINSNNDGSSSQTISALAQDLHGNPVENGTVIFFGLVDNPDLSGPPYLGYISAGTNGATNGTTTFTSSSNSFITDGLMDDDLLIILEGRNEGGHRIKSVDSNTALTLYNTMNGSESGLDFVAGYAELGSICGSVQTGNLETDSSCTPTTVGGAGSIKGVAHTSLTWVPQAIFKPYHLYAESVGGDVGDTLADSYPAAAPVAVTVTLTPSSVQSGTTGIFVVAEFKDGSGNPIQGLNVLFSSSNPAQANFAGSTTTTEDTGSDGRASTNEVTITAANGPYSGEAALTIQPRAPAAAFTCTDSGDGINADCLDNSTSPAGTTITAWSWDVGCNGSEDSDLVNPTFALGAGTTSVCLTVTNDAGCPGSDSGSVTIAAVAPTADFVYTDNGDGTANLTEASTNPGTTTISSRLWTLPAGASFVAPSGATDKIITVDFGGAGVGPYNVSLQVTNNLGLSDTVTKPVTISAAPTASFTFFDIGDGTADFTDTSTTPGTTIITDWLWTFPDGSTASVANPTGIDLALMPNNGTPGDFDVTLQATNNVGETNAITQTVSLTATPIADFQWTDNGDGTVSFDAAGSPSSSTPGNTTITNYAWTFTSGTPSSLPTNGVPTAGPVNWGTVGPGPHSVTLQVTNNFGDTSDPEIKNVTVTATPTAGASVNDISAGTACTLDILDNSTLPGTTGGITSWSWTFTPDVGPPIPSSTMDPGNVLFPPLTTTVSIDLTVTNAFGVDSITTINQTVAICPAL